jgi:hypothetical protein
MAITNAQQFKQLVNPPMKGKKRPGYRGDDAARASGARGASRDTSRADPGGAGRGDTRGDPGPADDRSSALQTYNQKVVTGRLSDEDYETFDDVPLNKREQEFKNFLDRRNKVNLFGLSKAFTAPAQRFSDFNASINRPFFEKVIRAGKIPGLNFDSTEDEFEKAYQDYMSERLAGNIDAYGNPLKGNYYDSSGNLVVRPDDGPDNTILFPQDTTPGDGDGDDSEDEDDTNTGGLALRFRKDGGRINAMDGGMMSPEGGIMDLETGRQMYFLGKLVKKATRAVKKIVKSPIGKAAILGGLTFGIPGVSSGFFSKGLSGTKFGLGAKNFLTDSIFGKVTAGDVTTTRSGGLFDLIKKNPFGAITAASALSGLLTKQDEDDEEEEFYRGPSLDIAGIRNNPYDFRARRFAVEGGIMRTGYQEGSKEPVAKKTMPLLDMGGKEMDLREDGGFVPIGRMEKADDVPARLSKNEFVFTADAVRNAGEGDVDKGAEVMYNMMKNLESGGEVSEESQGLSGARKMFQTSKRLEEVL